MIKIFYEVNLAFNPDQHSENGPLLVLQQSCGMRYHLMSEVRTLSMLLEKSWKTPLFRLEFLS